MHIYVLFRFNNEPGPIAVTGVEGDVTDMILPCVGDIVEHSDSFGEPFRGKVTDRVYRYELAAGRAINGAVSVTLCLDRTTVQ